MNSDRYNSYSKWKNWQGAPLSGVMDERYAIEMARAEIAPGSKILEIGFGDGAFLDWAAKDYRISGIEIIPELVDRAKGRGHDVHLGQLDLLVSMLGAPFDAIVLFDVLEHLPVDILNGYLKIMRDLLRPEGKIIARTPNGMSLAGLVHQNGDITHVIALTPESMAQLGMMNDFELIYAGNAARSNKGGKSRAALKKKLAYLARGVFEVIFGMIYFGRRLPLDADLTFVLKRRA